MSQQKEEYSGKAIRNDRVCFDCASPIHDPRTLVCPKCGGLTIDDRRARPSLHFPAERVKLPPPFDMLEIEMGSSILLSGDAGSGKTTICLNAGEGREMMIEASEQGHRSIATAWRRIRGDQPFPAINGCYSWDHLNEDLQSIQPGDIVIVDSVSQLAEGLNSADLVRAVIERVRTVGAIVFFIAQFTKDKEMLGPNMLRHLVDVVCNIPPDSSGMRRLCLDKNRYGGLTARYFSIGADGVKPQVFDQAYSVEGPPGKYELRLFPLGNAKWDGLLGQLAKAGVFLEGYASAAIPCSGYRTGYAVPPDVKEREAFATEHGLNWLSPERALELLAEHASNPDPF